MFARILVILGLLSRTRSAIPYIRLLAKNFGSDIHLLGLSTESRQVWDQSLISYSEGISRSLHQDGIVVKTDFIRGNPAVEVVRYSETNGINLIVTTTGETNEITGSILNNVSRRMGRSFSSPILSIPPQAARDFDVQGKPEFIKILVPLDRTPFSEIALPYAEELAHKLNCSVTLLNVNTPPVRGVPVLNNEIVKMTRTIAVNYLKKICSRLDKKNIRADFLVAEGNAAKAILKSAKTSKFSLIVMATRGASGMERWFQGRTAEKVSMKSEIPVMSVCSPGPDIRRGKEHLIYGAIN